jgi:hypothetical protein
MKAKLIKTDKDNYTLFDEKGIPIGATPNVLSNNTFSKLSKQNCDELFGVVDVEKLAEEEVKQEYYDWGGAVFNEDYLNSKRLHFIEGFNKAMELNKDKVFTLEQAVEMAKILVSNPYEKSGKTAQELVDAYIKSLQQPTEIEVEIVMEKVVDETKVIGAVKGVKGSGDKITTYKSVPKLDSEGCLILKQIK